MAFTCNAFKHFKTLSKLMEQDVPPEMTVFPIKWTDEAMDSPERKHLCAIIDGLIEYSEEQKMSLVEDLITIASKNLENIYRPGEEPVDGCCPVIGCAFQISG